MAEEPFFSLGTFLAIGSFVVSLLITIGVLYWYFSARSQALRASSAQLEPDPEGHQPRTDPRPDESSP